MLALGRALGLELIAEGVETEAQRAFLAAEGCQCGQGWYFGRALAPEQLAPLLAGPR